MEADPSFEVESRSMMSPSLLYPGYYSTLKLPETKDSEEKLKKKVNMCEKNMCIFLVVLCEV